jgi:chorismate mutase
MGCDCGHDDCCGTHAAQDRVLKQFRDQITDVDLKLLDLINKRLKLVKQTQEYKRNEGMNVVDPDREEWMMPFLIRANRGQLSEQGLREIFSHMLTLLKVELMR